MNIVTKVFAIFLLTLLSCSKETPTSNNNDTSAKITLLSPIGGEIFYIGQMVIIKWMTTNVTGNVKIDLLKDGQPVYSINNVQNSGNFSFAIPISVIPAKTYQLKISSETNSNIFDLTASYFEVGPDINGRWYYSSVSTNGYGLKMDLVLNYSNNLVSGTGYFYFKYNHGGIPTGYESGVIITGNINYPTISFTLNGSEDKKFNFIGNV